MKSNYSLVLVLATTSTTTSTITNTKELIPEAFVIERISVYGVAKVTLT